MPVGHAVTATSVFGVVLSRFGCGLGLFGCRVDDAVDQLDDFARRGRIAQRLDEVLAHQCPGEAGQQLHVLGAACFRGRDQERQIRGSVRRAEVDRRVQPGEPDRGGIDIWRSAVRDRDAAGQPGGRLLFARHRRRDQPVGVMGAACVGEPADEPADNRLLVSAGVDVEEHQIGVDDRLGGGACHGDTFVLVVGEIGAIGVTRTALRSICAGVGSADPGSAAAALPYATAICSRWGGTAPPTSARR